MLRRGRLAVPVTACMAIPVRTALRLPVANCSHLREKSTAARILQKVGAMFGLEGNKTTLGNARALLFNCKAQAEKQDWFSRGLVTEDFRSKHTLLIVHVWMVHKRLQKEGKRGELVEEALFDEMWDDTCSRIRGQGINELSVNKYLEQVQGYSFRTCLDLDMALALLTNPAAAELAAEATERAVREHLKSEQSSAPDSDKNITSVATSPSSDGDGSGIDVEKVVLDEIGGVLWRMLYLRRNDIEVDHVLELAKYVRQEQQSLLDLSSDAIFEGRIKWGPIPPNWKSNVWKQKGSRSKESASDGEWREATAPDGKIYYWNTVTRETRWEKP